MSLTPFTCATGLSSKCSNKEYSTATSFVNDINERTIAMEIQILFAKNVCSCHTCHRYSHQLCATFIHLNSGILLQYAYIKIAIVTHL